MTENLIELSILIVSLLTHYLKSKADLKITRRKSENSHKYLTGKLDNLELMVKTDISKREFKKDLANRLSLTSLNIISANSDLNKEAISILNVLNENITDFAIKYHSSTYRIDKDLIKNYLTIEINSVLEKDKHAINDIVPGKKNNFELMEFIRFYNPELSVNINTLKQRLYENGLTDTKYIELFDNFIKTTFKFIIKGLRKWQLQ